MLARTSLRRSGALARAALPAAPPSRSAAAPPSRSAAAPPSRSAAAVSQATPTEQADAVVIGAGVVGLAVARALSLKGREVLVLESAPTFGSVTSSRNSEVIHAGLYYPPNSLKARFCVRGRKMMYEYCAEHEIPYKKIGKLVVATGIDEVPKLEGLLRCGVGNGVEGLRMLDGSEAMRMEPELRCVKALFSPESGIVDSHSFMLSLVGEAENFRTTFCYNTTVVGGHVEDNCLRLHIFESNELENQVGNSQSPNLSNARGWRSWGACYTGLEWCHQIWARC